MEEKTTAQKGNKEDQATPWIQKVRELTEKIGEGLQDKKDVNRGFIVLAVDRTPADDCQLFGAIAGGNIALGEAVKHVLTSKQFAPHLQTAAKMLAMESAEAMASGRAAVVINVKATEAEDDDQDDEDDAPEVENETQEGAEA